MIYNSVLFQNNDSFSFPVVVDNAGNISLSHAHNHPRSIAGVSEDRRDLVTEAATQGVPRRCQPQAKRDCQPQSIIEGKRSKNGDA